MNVSFVIRIDASLHSVWWAWDCPTRQLAIKILVDVSYMNTAYVDTLITKEKQIFYQ